MCPPHEFGGRRVAGQVDAQHERVGEVADQRFDRGVLAPGDRDAEHDVGLAGQPVQHGREPGQQHGVERGARRLGHCGHRIGEPIVQPYRQVAAPVRRHVGTGPVRRHRGQHRRAREPIGPVGELPGQPWAGRLGVLPRRPVGERNRQVGQVGFLVGGDQFVHEESGGPAVEHDVVHHDQQHMLGRAEHEQPERERPTLGEIEPDSRVLGRRVRHSRQVTDRQGDRPVRQHLLGDVAVRHDEPGPQRVVPVDHRGDRVAQPVRVERSGDPHAERDVVRRVAGIEPVEQPQPFLRRGQRHRPGVRAPGERCRPVVGRRSLPAVAEAGEQRPAFGRVELGELSGEFGSHEPTSLALGGLATRVPVLNGDSASSVTTAPRWRARGPVRPGVPRG